MRAPILLIGGLGQGSWVWRDVAAELERDRPVVASEARGTGPLSKIAARTTVAEMAGDAHDVLRRHRIDRAHGAGLSMGGYVALTLALAQPALVRSLVGDVEQHLLRTGGSVARAADGLGLRR